MSFTRNVTSIRQLPYIIQTSPSPPETFGAAAGSPSPSMSIVLATSASNGSQRNEEGSDFQNKMTLTGLNVPPMSRRGSKR